MSGTASCDVPQAHLWLVFPRCFASGQVIILIPCFPTLECSHVCSCWPPGGLTVKDLNMSLRDLEKLGEVLNMSNFKTQSATESASD